MSHLPQSESHSPQLRLVVVCQFRRGFVCLPPLSKGGGICRSNDAQRKPASCHLQLQMTPPRGRLTVRTKRYCFPPLSAEVRGMGTRGPAGFATHERGGFQIPLHLRKKTDSARPNRTAPFPNLVGNSELPLPVGIWIQTILHHFQIIAFCFPLCKEILDFFYCFLRDFFHICVFSITKQLKTLCFQWFGDFYIYVWVT